MTEGGYVLVVDDDADVREMILLVLEARGVRAAGAADGVEALEQLSDHELPSLILLDLRMPRLNGEQLVERLRARPALAAIPVVVLSGDNQARTIARAIGARGCLVKPVELGELLAVVGRFAPAHP